MHTNRRPRITLVEDDPFIQRMYDRALNAAGFDVSLSPDGTIVYDVSKIKAPDLILMDVMMPNFNGLEALKELKSGTGTRLIPVIMLSAYDDPALIQQAMDLGAEYYLVKSQNDPQEVVRIIKDVLAKHGVISNMPYKH
jgi:CheY-like chemotaxis protein